MSKRVPQSKRLQLINKWLRGIEDDDFEVFPTKTEGKYIVRPRKEPLVKPHSEPSTEESSIEPQVEEQEVEEPTEEPTIKPPTKSLPKKSQGLSRNQIIQLFLKLRALAASDKRRTPR